MSRLFRALSLILIAAAFSIFVHAEDKPPARKTAATSGELFETIARMDSAIFDAFNAHDVDRLMALFTDDLEVYPIKDYGAMEIGEHQFCHKEDGKDDCGTFKFAMVWRKTGEFWNITRVMSWGHQPPR